MKDPWHHIGNEEIEFGGKDIRNGTYLVYTSEDYDRILRQKQWTDEKEYLADAREYRLESCDGHYVYVPDAELFFEMETYFDELEMIADEEIYHYYDGEEL